MSLDDLEKRLTDFSNDVEKRFEEFGKRLEEKFRGDKRPDNEENKTAGTTHKRHETSFWGMILIVIGAVLLGNHFHWFYLDIPIFPAAIIILGVYLIIDHQRK